jgi:hypothetical protein
MIQKTPNLCDLSLDYAKAKQDRCIKQNQFDNCDPKFAEILALELKAAEMREQLILNEIRGGVKNVS